MESIIKIEGLKKSYGEVKAVDDISFEVKRGDFFAFLGVNGAGKSTTISIICGVLSKNDGKVYIDGKDIDLHMDELKSKIGVVFQDSVLDKALTVEENIRYRAAMYGIFGEEYKKRYDKIRTLLDLDELKGRAVGKLSGGQRRRADIARALISNPEILILDEPTTGLDPQTRQQVWIVIDKLRKEEDLTVFLTTHYMEEAADADNIVILNKGKIVAEGTPIELKNKYTGDYVSMYNIDEQIVKSLGKKYEKIPNGYRLFVANTEEATNLILSAPQYFKDYEITKGKLDDVFINVTGEKTGVTE